MYDMQVLDTGSKLFDFNLPAIVEETGDLVAESQAFNFSNSSNIPYLYYRFTGERTLLHVCHRLITDWSTSAGTRTVVIDVLSGAEGAGNTDVAATIEEDSYVGRNPLPGAYGSYESTYEMTSWDGSLEDGSPAPNGPYRVRVR